MNPDDILMQCINSGLVLFTTPELVTARVVDLVLPRGRGQWVVAFSGWWAYQDAVPNPSVEIYTVELEAKANQFVGRFTRDGVDYDVAFAPLDDPEDHATFKSLRYFTDRDDVRPWYTADLRYLATAYGAEIDTVLDLFDARPVHNHMEETRRLNTAVRRILVVNINGPDGLYDVVVCDERRNAATFRETNEGRTVAREWVTDKYRTLDQFADGIKQRSLYGALAFDTPEVIEGGGTVTAVAITRGRRTLAGV